MTAEATAAVHAQIEWIAAVVGSAGHTGGIVIEVPTEMALAATRSDRHPGDVPVLMVCDNALHVAEMLRMAAPGPARPMAAVAWALANGPRAIRDWWPGWSGSTTPMLASTALRALGPPEMLAPLADADADAADHRCDVCGEDAAPLSCAVQTFGPLVVTTHVGPCCIDIVEPDAEGVPS